MSTREKDIPAPIITRIRERANRNERYLDVIDALFESMILRDPVTAEHSLIMAHYSSHLAMIYDREQAELYFAGSLTHDIGKLGMKDEILKGSQKLSLEERGILRQHVEDGARLLTELRMPQLVIDITQYHHERYNGSGYLLGLSGEEIPLAGRISAITDTYASLIAGRPYQEYRRHEVAIDIMLRDKILFDPVILESFVRLSSEKKVSAGIGYNINKNQFQAEVNP